MNNIRYWINHLFSSGEDRIEDIQLNTALEQEQLLQEIPLTIALNAITAKVRDVVAWPLFPGDVTIADVRSWGVHWLVNHLYASADTDFEDKVLDAIMVAICGLDDRSWETWIKTKETARDIEVMHFGNSEVGRRWYNIEISAEESQARSSSRALLPEVN